MARQTALRTLGMVIGLALLLGGLALLLPTARVAAASTLHVTDCRDDGANTLRGKIASAGAGDTIVFDQNCTITLSTGTLALTKDVTIDGTGRTVVIDGGCTANCGTANAVGGVRVLSVSGGVTAALKALTIQNGVATNVNGGGIDNEFGMLTVTNCQILNNVALSTDVHQVLVTGGGIQSHGGTLTVTGTTFSGNTGMQSGAVSTMGITTTVTNSTFANNDPNSIDILGGSTTVTSSTFADTGFGILNETNGTLMVTNSTFTGNDTGISNESTASVTNSTITGNSRGIFNAGADLGIAGVLTMTNSILSGNSSNDLVDDNAGQTTNSHTLIGGTPLLGTFGNYGGPTQTFPLLPGSPAIGAGTTGAGIPTTDQRGVARTGHNDQGAFQSQGFTLTKTGGDNQSQQTLASFPAPLTLTVAATAAGAPYHEPIQGGMLSITTPSSGASAAVTGNPASLPVGGQVTLHATANGTGGGPYAVTISAGGPYTTSFLLTNVAPPAHSTYTVGTTADHAGGSVSAATCRTAGNTTCALRDAIAYAVSGTDTINFNTTGRGTITLAGANGPLIPLASVTITGPGAMLTTVDGGCTFSNGMCQSGGVTVLEVSKGLTVSLSGLTIQHGNASVTDPNDPGNQDGGAISNLGGNLTVTNCTVSNNAASGNGNGGAIYTDGGQLVVQSSTFTGNHAHNSAAISNRFSGGVVTVTNSTFTGNTADSAAGVGNNFGTFTVTNSTLTGNTAGIGGGLLSSGGTLTITNTIVAGNTSPDIGGGVRITSGGHNLFGDITGATITLDPGDLVNPAPLLGPPGNYGGSTWTIPLLLGSPAIDAGDDAVCAGATVGNKDQRGIARPQGAHCDIGAFEYAVISPLPGPKPPGPVGGPPNPLPGARPTAAPSGSKPNPLPTGRP
jgi:hypothetical protein